MPATHCSHCGKEIDAIPLNETDTMFDWLCPNCGRGVLINGNAREQQRQREMKEQVTRQVQDLASELDTASYEPAPYSLEELKDRLKNIVDDIEAELNQRSSG